MLENLVFSFLGGFTNLLAVAMLLSGDDLREGETGREVVDKGYFSYCDYF